MTAEDVTVTHGLPSAGREAARARKQGCWPDADAEIEPVPTAGGGRKREVDRLSNIIKTFNDQFGSIPWTDGDRVHRLITEDIPSRVAANGAYQNARKNSDKQNARIEHDRALARMMTAVLRDDTELFKQFSDNEGFRKWLTDTGGVRADVLVSESASGDDPWPPRRLTACRLLWRLRRHERELDTAPAVICVCVLLT